MINLAYGFDQPTNVWRGMNTVVKELELVKDKNGYRLNIAPVESLKKYAVNTERVKKLIVNKNAALPVSKTDLAKAEINLTLKDLNDGVYTFTLSNKGGDVLKFGLDSTNTLFFIDRSQSGNGTIFEKRTKDTAKMLLFTAQKQVTIKILLDKTSIEIFYNNGEKLMTEIFFPNSPFTDLNVDGPGKFTIENLEINQFDFKQ